MRVKLVHAAYACVIAAAVVRVTAASGALVVRPITWADVTTVHPQLASHGLTARSFASRIAEIRRSNAQRIREGDLDHLIFYVLQSTRFTDAPAIEPALSAKAFVATSRIPDDVRVRAAALIRALDAPAADPRLAYFRGLVSATFPNRRQREGALLREYERVMRFLYEKEFVAQRSERRVEAVAELYRTRGLSTDTAVEAGYLVHLGLGVAKSLDPERRIRRVLIVGPGLDLAPRTAMREWGPPESYQPWAVMDALLALGLSWSGDLEVVAADINPRVVEHLRRSRTNPPTLVLTSEIQDSETVKLTDEYRAYFGRLGRSIGEEVGVLGGAMSKSVRVHRDAARALAAMRLDIVTERIQGAPFDLVIATNILPYFGEVELMLAMSNVAAMLKPGGLFLHNEPRPSLGDITTAVGLPFEQSRHVTIATVRGASAPLIDSVYLHRKASSSQVSAPRGRLKIASGKLEAGS